MDLGMTIAEDISDLEIPVLCPSSHPIYAIDRELYCGVLGGHPLGTPLCFRESLSHIVWQCST
jgi:hypothetical protein